jgi:F0F1-type ATP synthase assembly protein I
VRRLSHERSLDELNLRDQITRIDRAIAETHKSQAETNKLQAESAKFQAEATKLRVDRWIAPLLVIASVIGGTIVAHFLGAH